MNRRTEVIDATGYRSDTTYNSRGDVVAMTNANNETIKFEVDALGRKTATIDPKGYRTEFQYDANNLICPIKPMPRQVWTNSYDPWNNRTSQQNGTVLTSYVYDNANQLTQIKNMFGLFLWLPALTLTTIQTSQTPIHNNTGFGVTLFTEWCAFREAFIIHFFACFGVFS